MTRVRKAYAESEWDAYGDLIRATKDCRCHSCKGGASWYEVEWVRRNVPDVAVDSSGEHSIPVRVPPTWIQGRVRIHDGGLSGDKCEVIRSLDWVCPWCKQKAHHTAEIMHLVKRLRPRYRVVATCEECRWMVCPDCGHALRPGRHHGGTRFARSDYERAASRGRRRYFESEDEDAWQAEVIEVQHEPRRQDEVEAGLVEGQDGEEAPLNAREVEFELEDTSDPGDRHIEDDDQDDLAAQWLRDHQGEQARGTGGIEFEYAAEEDAVADIVLEDDAFAEISTDREWCTRPIFPVTVLDVIPEDSTSVVRAFDNDPQWPDEFDPHFTWPGIEGYKVTITRTGDVVVKWRSVDAKKYARWTPVLDTTDLSPVPAYVKLGDDRGHELTPRKVYQAKPELITNSEAWRAGCEAWNDDTVPMAQRGFYPIAGRGFAEVVKVGTRGNKGEAVGITIQNTTAGMRDYLADAHRQLGRAWPVPLDEPFVETSSLSRWEEGLKHRLPPLSPERLCELIGDGLPSPEDEIIQLNVTWRQFYREQSLAPRRTRVRDTITLEIPGSALAKLWREKPTRGRRHARRAFLREWRKHPGRFKAKRLKHPLGNEPYRWRAPDAPKGNSRPWHSRAKPSRGGLLLSTIFKRANVKPRVQTGGWMRPDYVSGINDPWRKRREAKSA